MPNRCCAPNCKTGYDSDIKIRREQGLPNLNLYLAPKDPELFQRWKSAIESKREGFEFQPTHYVCELHFSAQFFSEEETLNFPDGSTLTEKKRKTLDKTAVPHIFPNCPKYLSRDAPRKRKSPKKRYSDEPGSKRRLPKMARLGEIVSLNVDSPPRTPPPLACSAPAVVDSVDTVNLSGVNVDGPSFIEDFGVLQVESDSISAPPGAPSPVGEAEKPIIRLSLTMHNTIHQNPQLVPLPNKMWAVLQDNKTTTFAHSSPKIQIDRHITFEKKDLQVKAHVYLNGKKCKWEKPLNNLTELVHLLNFMDGLRLCPGIDGERGKCCSLYLASSRSIRCKFCSMLKKAMISKQQRQIRLKVQQAKKNRSKNAKIQRLKKKVISMKRELKKCCEDMRNMSDQVVEKLLSGMPEKHQEAVKACIMASKEKTKNTRRYSQQWMYECILMRIKSGSLYRKMLRDNLLPLPCLRTIQRWIKKLKPCFGFHEPTFKLMEKKAQTFTEAQRHGCLLADEIALDEGIYFDKESLLVNGFVDLDKVNPVHADSTLGDHALVFIFQPFQGQWFQAIGAFCSRGAAKGPQLERLITEAILQLEKHGYFVDEVTTDGGSWNRNMWTIFGIDEKNVTCTHPTCLEFDPPPRKLRFCSDFPHLIKSIWARVRKSMVLKIPEGLVKLDHWKAVAKHDSNILKHIQVCWKLTEDHINPTNYQSMNVKMAFEFFSEDVAIAMEHYRDNMQVPELQDSHASVAFIRHIKALITAMNARNCWDSLKDAKDNESWKAITNFIDYLGKWKEEVSDPNLRLAHQTHLGLLVTLRGTLDLVTYLCGEVKYKYLMTRRLNQDALEHFFGRIREQCGSNSHPDPKQFIEVFRLLQCASLLKPPRGSNITGGEMLQCLTSITDIIAETNSVKKIELEEVLDRILTLGDEDDILEKHFKPVNERDHTYHMNVTIDAYAFSGFAGYVARKARQFSCAKTCEACFLSLKIPSENKENEKDDSNYLIEKRSRGYLLTPSDELKQFLYRIEQVIVKVTSQTTMHRHILYDVLDELQKESLPNLVGCPQHVHELSKAVMNFFLKTRLIFACKRYMKKLSIIHAKKKKAKSLVKLTRLNAIKPNEHENVFENFYKISEEEAADDPKPTEQAKKRGNTTKTSKQGRNKQGESRQKQDNGNDRRKESNSSTQIETNKKGKDSKKINNKEKNAMSTTDQPQAPQTQQQVTRSQRVVRPSWRVRN